MEWVSFLLVCTSKSVLNRSFSVEYGNYWDHLEQFYCIRHLPNLKIIKYEDMKHNLRKTLLELAIFLEKDLPEEKLELLVQHLQFDNMKVNPAVNYSMRPPPNENVQRMERQKNTGYNFIRRGETGSHEDEMPKEMIEKFDAVTRDRFGSYENLNPLGMEMCNVL